MDIHDTSNSMQVAASANALEVGSNLAVPDTNPGTAGDHRVKDKFLPCLLRRCRPILTHGQMDVAAMLSLARMNVTVCELCGASPMHRCGMCGRSVITHGYTSQDEENRYVFQK